MEMKKMQYALMVATVFFCSAVTIAADDVALLEAKIAQQEKELGLQHIDVAANLNKLAALYERQSRYDDAEPLYRRTLAILEKQLGSEHRNVAIGLSNLANVYRVQGRYSQAEPLYKRALLIVEKLVGSEHSDVAAILNNQAELYRLQGRYGEAETLLKRALAIRQKQHGEEHPEVVQSLVSLAHLHLHYGRYGDAEPLYKRALAIAEKQQGSEHRNVAIGLSNLANVYRVQGRYSEAEPLYKRSLAIREKLFGAEHNDVALVLNNLAGLYEDQGRPTDAELLLKRSLAIREPLLGPEHPEFATSLNNLGNLYRSQSRYGESESVLKRALAIREKVLGPEHADVATSLNNLAKLYGQQGRYMDMEPLYKRSLAIMEKQYGPEHPNVATCLNNIGELYRAQGRHGDAERMFQRSLTSRERLLGPDHPTLANSLHNLAELYRAQNRDVEALRNFRRAFQIYRNRFVKGDSDSTGEQSEKRSRKEKIISYLSLLAKIGQQNSTKKLEFVEEAFEGAQVAQTSSTGDVVAKMAARFAAGTGTLSEKARERQDMIGRLQKLDSALIKAVSLGLGKRNAVLEQQMRDDLAGISLQLSELDKELANRFPDYAELTAPKPLPIAEAQKLLASDEALLVYTVAEKFSYVFLLRSNKAEFVEVPIGGSELNNVVQRLRQRLDPGKNDELLAFDAETAHELYQKILAPVAPYLVGAKHIMLVPDGALQSLPFGVLPAEAPKEAVRNPEDHKTVAWLAKRYAFTTLPSVSALRALRTFARREAGNDPFLGVGDPLLEGGVGKDKSLKVTSLLTTRGIADVEALRKAPRLPETADELRAMAKTLGAKEDQLFLQERATEATLKGIDLSRFQTIAFSTHGVMAGELKGIDEPGLVLTPPRVGTELDDGYLSASEIAQLKLNADWVLLSACNTAAPDGTPGADGLSGLGRAFFYAGARTMLVSHWPVDSEATKDLQMTLLKEYTKNSSAGKAEALRQAVLAVMNSSKNTDYAHPMFWAPFVVAGEGGGNTKLVKANP